MHYGKYLAGAALIAAAILGGCATTDDADRQSAQLTAAAAPQQRAARKASPNAAALAAYKRQIAQRIYDAQRKQTFDGKLPPLLKSVVVLNVTVDEHGNPTELSVRRSNGFKHLERAALESVRKAGPFPKPSPAVLGGGDKVTYLETWLFRDDGKFQIRTLADKQMGVEGVVARR